MSSSEAPPRRGSRRFVWLSVAIVAAIGLYTAGWFYVAGELTAGLDRVLRQVQAQGHRAACSNPTARGYPFRIGLFCDEVVFHSGDGGVSATATGLRSAAQVYQPRRIVGEVDDVDVVKIGGLSFKAGDIRYSARIARPLPERISVDVQNPLIARVSGTTVHPDPVARAESGQAHFRVDGAKVDLAASLASLRFFTFGEGGAPPPPLDAEADIGLPDGVSLLTRGGRSLRGVTAEIRSARLSGGGAELLVTGTASTDADGLVNAALTVNVTNPVALLAMAAAANPSLKAQIDRIAPIVKALGDKPRLPLTISKGVVRMSFFVLGKIPPLD